MNIEQLVKAFATYFREDEDTVRQIIVDNLDLSDMGLDVEFTLDDDLQEWEEPRDLTEEELREEVDRIRNTPNWDEDPELAGRMEALAREAFDGMSMDKRTLTLLDMVLSLCDEVDNLRNKLDNLNNND